MPFLGRETRQGRVLYLDCENAIGQVDTIVPQVSKCLGVPKPDDLLLWNLNDSDGTASLEDLIGEVLPSWVIIDPLNAFFQDIEASSENTTRAYQALRFIMKTHNCAITAIHHIRKPSNSVTVPSLAGPGFRDWFLQARGSRALINGSDFRLGVEAQSDTELAFRGYERVGGDAPLMKLTRVLDPDGEPQGFRFE